MGVEVSARRHGTVWSRIGRLAAGVTVVMCGCTPATVVSAWGTGTTLPRPARPDIACCNDPKDPLTYMALGAGMLDRGRADSAAAAFYWASRLDPTLAEPYYARSVALLLTHARQRRQSYSSDVWVPMVDLHPWRVAVIDSLRREALSRDPFLRPRYDHLLTGRPPAFVLAQLRDPATRGYWLYDIGQTALADSLLGVALQKEPGRAHLREIRAKAQYERGEYDSAAVQLRILLDTLSHRDSSSHVLAYSSKEMIYYALGYTHAQRKDTVAARLAFESAIGENAAFYPAHARLATLAINRADYATAVRELAIATEIAPNDPTLRLFLGASLLGTGEVGRAVEQLMKAIDLDPYFARPYLYLGKAHEARRDAVRAVEAYESYANLERFHSAERVWAQAYSDTLRTRHGLLH